MLINKPKLLSLIIPVYKQEKTISSNLRMILKELRILPCNYEVIVVVDGSVDRSKEEALKIKSPKLKVFGYDINHGKGYAVRFGMSKSRGDVVGFLDSGGDLSMEALLIMLELFLWHNADAVIGSKRHPLSKVNYPQFRRVLSWGYQGIVKVLFGLNVSDTQVGMKIYKRDVLEEVLPRLSIKKFAFDIEILAVAYYLGHIKIYESPIELTFPGESTITNRNFWRISLNMLFDTFAVFYRLHILHYYDYKNRKKWLSDKELILLTTA